MQPTRSVTGLAALVLAAAAVTAVAVAPYPPTLVPESCGRAPGSLGAVGAGLAANLTLPAELVSGSVVSARLSLSDTDSNVVSDGTEPQTGDVRLSVSNPPVIDVLFVRNGRVMGRAAGSGAVTGSVTVRSNQDDPIDGGRLAPTELRGNVTVAGCPRVDVTTGLAVAANRARLPPGSYDVIAVAGPFISTAVPVQVVPAGTAAQLATVTSGSPQQPAGGPVDGEAVSCRPAEIETAVDTDYETYQVSRPVTFLETMTNVGGRECPVFTPEGSTGAVTGPDGALVWNFWCDRPTCPDGGYAFGSTGVALAPGQSTTSTVAWGQHPSPGQTGGYTYEVGTSLDGRDIARAVFAMTTGR